MSSSLKGLKDSADRLATARKNYNGNTWKGYLHRCKTPTKPVVDYLNSDEYKGIPVEEELKKDPEYVPSLNMLKLHEHLTLELQNTTLRSLTLLQYHKMLLDAPGNAENSLLLNVIHHIGVETIHELFLFSQRLGRQGCLDQSSAVWSIIPDVHSFLFRCIRKYAVENDSIKEWSKFHLDCARDAYFLALCEVTKSGRFEFLHLRLSYAFGDLILEGYRDPGTWRDIIQPIVGELIKYVDTFKTRVKRLKSLSSKTLAFQILFQEDMGERVAMTNDNLAGLGKLLFDMTDKGRDKMYKRLDKEPKMTRKELECRILSKKDEGSDTE